MIARELINASLPVLNFNDTGQKVLNIMDSFKVSHLPVISDDQYVGLISDKLIYDNEMENCALKDNIQNIKNTFYT